MVTDPTQSGDLLTTWRISRARPHRGSPVGWGERTSDVGELPAGVKGIGIIDAAVLQHAGSTRQLGRVQALGEREADCRERGGSCSKGAQATFAYCSASLASRDTRRPVVMAAPG